MTTSDIIRITNIDWRFLNHVFPFLFFLTPVKLLLDSIVHWLLFRQLKNRINSRELKQNHREIFSNFQLSLKWNDVSNWHSWHKYNYTHVLLNGILFHKQYIHDFPASGALWAFVFCSLRQSASDFEFSEEFTLSYDLLCVRVCVSPIFEAPSSLCHAKSVHIDQKSDHN